MKKKLIEILREQLIGKKIKLYKVSEKRNNNNMEYFVVNKEDIEHFQKITIIEETFGFIKSIELEYDNYDGDSFWFHICDEQMKPMHVDGIYSLTNEIEIL